MSYSTAELHDANPGRVDVCETQFRSFGQRRSFGGPCVTVKLYEDHRPLKELVERPDAGQGRVLVVDGGGSFRIGVMGDMMATNALKNGWIGAVIYGVVRDSDTLDALDFGVKAIGTTARRGDLETSGQIDLPVSFGGVSFSPGDWVYADADAVIVSKEKLA